MGQAVSGNMEARLIRQGEKVNRLMSEVRKVVVGQEQMIHRLLIGLFTNGHILLEGVPGLAKTLTVSTLAKALQLSYHRIQFTPDLLPADLIGTLIYNQKESRFEVRKGPVFAHIILADEINRSPAKVQSALLEAMQEKQVTIGDETFGLEEPFLVLATQNPIDQEGTYPLPEAQVDRFLMKVLVSYPDRDQEKEIMRKMAKTSAKYAVQPALSRQEIMEIRELVDNILLSEKLEDYIVDLVMATRKPGDFGMENLAEFIEFGASPRASLALNLGSKAHAFLDGRGYVLPEDIKAIAHDVLRHRIILTYEAEAEDVKVESLIDQLLEHVPI
jgi:MoxR-like ATPase